MEANGFKKRIEKAFLNQEYLKLIFQYPAATKMIVKRGLVLSVAENSFDFNELLDGEVTYSYDYLVEIKEVKK